MSVTSLHPPLSRPPSALVVGLNAPERARAAQALSSAGFAVTTIDGFEGARAHLEEHRPAVLLTAVKLGGFNGLHLVLQARASDPSVAALVTIDEPDPVLEAEAARLGATFIVLPITDRELLAAVLRTSFRDRKDQSPLRPPFERRLLHRRVALVAYTPERRRHDRRRDLATLLRTVLVMN